MFRLQGFVLELATSLPGAFFPFTSAVRLSGRSVLQESERHVGSICLSDFSLFREMRPLSSDLSSYRVLHGVHEDWNMSPICQ